jgi:beta-glucosidase-like glycosyl hydrolase
MKKVVKIGFPIVCVIVVGGTFYLLNRASNKVDEASENALNTLNKVTQITNESVSNASNELTELSTEDDEVYSYTVETEEEIQNKEKIAKENEEKAISLVKEKDGKRNEEVYYTNESSSDEGYVIAVRRKSTTEAIIYYIVNIEKETVEVYY